MFILFGFFTSLYSFYCYKQKSIGLIIAFKVILEYLYLSIRL